MKFDKVRRLLGITVENLADSVGVSYIYMGKVLSGKTKCPYELEEKIKIFLANSYTERIGFLLNEEVAK